MIFFTGHRPQKLGGFNPNNPTALWVRGELHRAVQRASGKGHHEFISGMALGVDQWAAEIVLDLRKRLVCAIPFPSQANKWPEASQLHWHDLISRALLSGGSMVEVSPDPYSAGKMQIRNVYMVDQSIAGIAVWDGSSGGTGNCVQYALEQGKRVYQIDPTTRTAHRI